MKKKYVSTKGVKETKRRKKEKKRKRKNRKREKFKEKKKIRPRDLHYGWCFFRLRYLELHFC